MKICALRSFASLVLASLAVDHIAIAEGRQLNTAGTTRVAADTAATTEAKATFVFGGVSYFQRLAGGCLKLILSLWPVDLVGRPVLCRPCQGQKIGAHGVTRPTSSRPAGP